MSDHKNSLQYYWTCNLEQQTFRVSNGFEVLLAAPSKNFTATELKSLLPQNDAFFTKLEYFMNTQQKDIVFEEYLTLQLKGDKRKMSVSGCIETERGTSQLRLDFEAFDEYKSKSMDKYFKLVIQGAESGVWVWDVVSGKEFWSDKFYALLGYAPNEIMPSFDNFLNMLHEEDREAVMASIQGHLKNHQRYLIEFRMQLKSGEYRWFESSGQAEWNQEGEPQVMAGMIVDVHDKKIAQVKLKESEQRYNKALQNSKAGFYDCDLLTGKVIWSDRIYQILGYSKKDFEHGLDWSLIKSMIHSNDQESLTDILNAHLSNDTPLFAEFQVSIKGGGYKWIQLTGKAIRKADGTPIRLVGTLIDIHEIKVSLLTMQELASELEAANEELSTSNDQLTIHNRKLMDLSEALEREKTKVQEADRLKSRFLTNVSHEIRSPMNVILGYTQLMLEQDHTDMQLKQLQTIQRNGLSLINLIDDILDLSRIESGNFELNLAFMNLDHYLHELRESFILEILKKKLTIDLAYDVYIPFYLQLDTKRILQVVRNLLHNALKFTESGLIVLSADLLEKRDDETCDIAISVKDTGIGINDDGLEMIFEPFKHTDDPEAIQSQGVGLGLSICKQLVHSMKGELSVESEKGKGSAFTVTLKNIPFSERNAEGRKVERPRVLPIGVSGFEGDKQEVQKPQPKIVYVDDISDNLELTKDFLIGTGWELFTFSSATESLVFMQQQHPDVVILDLKMPEVDGFQLLEMIRNDAQLNGLPVIALTASAMPSDIEKIKEAGFDGYLSKPVMKKDLIDSISSFLK
ncbi:PAS domain-containing protein [Limibacter armeniacum]|uniref:PAS domain-containing sensor histidine kinase n=1 Tax=Limibacter armeniacum TaxID=466084 RepID=UPI002FE6B50E